MHSPEPKVEFTHTPSGGGQSESCVQSWRHASPPSSMHTSDAPQAKPGHTQRRAAQPANVQYCWQTAPPSQSPSWVQAGPTQYRVVPEPLSRHPKPAGQSAPLVHSIPGLHVPGGCAHAGGYATKAGTAARSAHWLSCSATHVTQVTRSPSVATGPLHDAPSGTATAGQLLAKPSADGARSSGPPHARSAPPHALQSRSVARATAAAIAGPAFPSPGSGHGFACTSLARASQHRASAFDVEVASRARSVPMAETQPATGPLADAAALAGARSAAAVCPMHATHVATSAGP